MSYDAVATETEGSVWLKACLNTKHLTDAQRIGLVSLWMKFTRERHVISMLHWMKTNAKLHE